MAQPNLSKAIKASERELEFLSLSGRQKGVKATREGQKISGVCQKDHLRNRGNEKGLQ